MARLLLARIITLTLLVAAPALAQQKPPAQPAKPAPPPAGAADIAAEPKLPEVDDPMLKPLPPPKNVLQNWRQAVDIARARSSALELSRAEIERAKGQQRQALAASLPTLTGTANVTYHILKGEGLLIPGAAPSAINTTRTFPDPATDWNAALALRIPVFAPQAWYDAGTASKVTRVARLNAKETQRVVLGAIATAVVDAVTAERQAEVTRVSLTAALNTYELNRRRAELGAASAFEVVRAEQEVALARAQVVSADELVMRTREALGLALGSSEPWSIRPNIQVDTLASDARNSCRPERNVESRPDIVARRADVEVAERGQGSIDRSFLPTVDALSVLTYWPNDERSVNRTHFTWTIGGVLTWVLYDGGARYGARDTYDAEVRIARSNLTQARREATVEVTRSFRAVRVAGANLGVSAQSRDLAAKSARLARIAFMNGTGTSFDLVDTSRRLREAELDLVIKEFELARAKVAALLALASCEV
jgi:outer membrane protein TolC